MQDVCDLYIHDFHLSMLANRTHADTNMGYNKK